MTPILLIPACLSSLITGISLGTSRRGLSMLPESPVRGVPMRAWRRYVAVMVVARPATRTPRGRLGAWGMDARHLRDAGLMTETHKATVGAETGVWCGSWVDGLDEAKFLGNPELQRAAFEATSRKLVPEARKHVGKVIGGVPCSLSGLLAVGHHAGSAGIAGWADDARVRAKFGNTTKSFERSNGIF
jgi:hypothetical protein